ncbi:malto-oligosyltrehalose synthase [Geobacter sp. AOG2]|uniref:malto-oligosyltrehalose synthase n=1 Tax=Geobacter sp. AOG2 TaxID=1566347 RepID=UPI001CC7571A|nr:malto-oligosyltrehalose synthase [Geobacter sp. AOG2]GFE60697.1 maltooligosyl trehalose synthase [Geobacter sp. AOG2]
MNGTGLRVPAATYRLQFNSHFRFNDAREIIPYLHAIGISHIYASPYFKAREGSLHGYDILDQNSLNPEIGSEDEFDALVGELKQWGMGQILDIVPNHMCIEGQGNAFWMDVLENGPSSSYANVFDIDWHPVKKELENKILIPILGDQYGTILENRELQICFEEGSFFTCYYDHKLPIIPKTYSNILTLGIEGLEQELSPAAPQFQELMSIVTALRHLPPTTEQNPELITERYREKEVVKRRLWNLYQNSGAIREFIDGNVVSFNGTKGNPRSFDQLDALLREQVYRISHWRVATEEINYRRFFDINSLGAIRMEDPAVFELTHRLIFSLVATGKINGLRIDHADGLQDPEDYIRRLQSGCFNQMYGGAPDELQLTGNEEDTETAAHEKYDLIVAADPSYKPFYIVGEKILLKGEKLPDGWQVFGTTGYDFVNQVNGLFVDTSNAKAFETLYTRFLQHRIDFPEVVYDKKKLVMQATMSSEINTLGHYLNKISEQNRHTRDFTLNSLIKAIVEVIAYFPVYRTYINSFDVPERDRQYLESAIGRAKRQNPATSASVFEFIRDVLLLRFPGNMTNEHKTAWVDFVKRFQQITGPVMAKGIEDTAFYIYNRLASLNEVGGSPERFGITMEAFHGQNIERYKNRPLAMLTTSTHDTKRSEDVRARINVLSEIPELWREALSRWGRQNRKLKMIVDGKPAPSRNEEYLLYQTLVGAWPICNPGDDEFAEFRARIKGYMLKAMREAKVHTSWISPNSLHEDAVMYFIDLILTKSSHNNFLSDFAEFQRLTTACGICNSLSQTLLKIASPGIPDFYQGNELWDFSLVDPDNRRPVDFGLRRRLLDDLIRMESSTGAMETAREVVANRYDGRIKLYLTRKALNVRRENRELFESGRYLPLVVEGSCQEHVCAFERSINNRSVIVVAPRLFSRLLHHDYNELPLGPQVWGDTRINQPFGNLVGRYRNIFTGEQLTLDRQTGQPSLALKDILASFPVAMLEQLD